MDDKMTRFLQMEADKDTDNITEEVNRDSHVQNVTAPDVIGDKLYAQIREHEAKKSHTNLSDEEKELIELGKVYKRRRKWRKWYVLAAVMVLAMMFGVTSMGGPEKVVEKVKWMLAGREQTNIDSDNDRVEESEGVSESEAYQQIENEFGFKPVRLQYLPEGMEFQEAIISKDVQCIQLIYDQKNSGTITYIMQPNYRIGSTGGDIEDVLLEEYTKMVEDIEIHIKSYYIEESKEYKWILEFEHKNVYCFMHIHNLDKEEIEKIINNLYFS